MDKKCLAQWLAQGHIKHMMLVVDLQQANNQGSHEWEL